MISESIVILVENVILYKNILYMKPYNKVVFLQFIFRKKCRNII